MKKNDDRKTVWAIISDSLKSYFKGSYQILILMSITLAVAIALCFVKISTTSTVSSFKIED